MANLITNKTKSSNKTGILTKGNVGIRGTNGIGMCNEGGTSADEIDINASIINVDDENCDIIPGHYIRVQEHAGQIGKRREEVHGSISSPMNNICKLFVKVCLCMTDDVKPVSIVDSKNLSMLRFHDKVIDKGILDIFFCILNF